MIANAMYPTVTPEDADLIDAAALRVGTTLHGKYHLDRVLGVGGMAVVFAATHRNGKRFAVKVLNPEFSSRHDIQLRFLREGYVANAVNHPGVVAVLDDEVTEDGSAFLVMELLEGSTVEALGARPGSRLPLRQALGIAWQLLDVLDKAHEKNIVHRDIKPANLFVQRDGRVKVLDFGLARLRDATTELNKTRTGDTMGTPAFMPPEQARGDVSQIDPRTDIWAVGATLFTALSGCLVHEGDNARQVMIRAATTPARSLAYVLPDAPESVVKVVSKALEFEKAERFASAAAMRDALACAYEELFGSLRQEDLISLFTGEVVPLEVAPLQPGPNRVSIATIDSEISPEPAGPNSSDHTEVTTLASPNGASGGVKVTRSTRAALWATGLVVALLASVYLLRHRYWKADDHAATITAASPVARALASIPPRVKGKNPFKGVQLYVNAYNAAAGQARLWQSSRPADAALMNKIAAQPTGTWMGDWTSDPESAARDLGSATNNAGLVPLVVIYNIPNRDCGQYSKGGVSSAPAYRRWIRQWAKGAGSYRMIVVLEPDALAMLTGCLSPADQAERVSLIRDAIAVLEASPGLSVYVDAGHPSWVPADEMAKRLMNAGIEAADGFALNVANFIATDANIEYGRAISAAIGGKHFVIDTSRNGNGATFEQAWCNPKGRALGVPPTTQTGEPLVDALLWIKPPGDSDGECNGGPKAGRFWPEQALDLARQAHWTLADSQGRGWVESP